jgi:hypothetical protein
VLLLLLLLLLLLRAHPHPHPHGRRMAPRRSPRPPSRQRYWHPPRWP